MKKQWIALILPISLFFSACSLLPAEEELPQAPILYQQEEVFYETVTVSRGNLALEKVFSSTYQPAQEEKLAFPFNGQAIGSIYVQRGDTVKAGDLVAELDNTWLRGQVDSQKRVIASLELQISQARDNLAVLNRKLEILRSGAETEPERYAAEMAAVRTRIGNLNDDIDYLRSLLSIEGTRLEELQDELRSRQLYAGFDGTVRYILDTGGGTAYSRKDQAVCILADYSNSAFVGTYEENVFTEGQYVNLVYNRADHEAVVSRVVVEEIPGKDPEDPPQTAVTVYFTLTTPDATISVDTRGTVRAVVDSRENVLLLPEVCVHNPDGAAYVYYLDSEGLRQAREVTVGLEANGMIEILSGLTEGEAVLLQD